MKTALQYLKVFGLLMVAFFVFGIVACLMPDSIVKRNVHYSVTRGDLVEDYPLAILHREQCKMDNFTDALILNQAYRMSKDSLMLSVMAPTRATGKMPSVDVLRHETEGQVTGIEYYPRYWHGNTFLARILLMLGDYSRIRVILYVLSTLLMVAACIALYRRAGMWPMVALLLALMGVNAYVMQFSMQFFPVLALVLVAVWLLCRKEYDSRRVCMIMFVIGSLTAYFDLLTAPLMTLGLPLCIAIWLMPKESTPKQTLGMVVAVCLMWVAGYAGSWVFKWLLATVLTPINVFADAFGQADHRANGIDGFTRFDAIADNFEMMSCTFIVSVVLLFLVVMALHFDGKRWWRALIYIGVALLPCAWYFGMANHSFHHFWFTYRSYAISLLGVMMAMLSMADLSEPRWRLHLRKDKNQ